MCGIRLTPSPIDTELMIMHIFVPHVAIMLEIISLSSAEYPRKYKPLIISDISVRLYISIAILTIISGIAYVIIFFIISLSFTFGSSLPFVFINNFSFFFIFIFKYIYAAKPPKKAPEIAIATPVLTLLCNIFMVM